MAAEDLIDLDGRQYVLATSHRVDDRTRVLKDGDSFAVFDRSGDIQSIGTGEQGIFHCGTRYLSRLLLRINGERPRLLNSAIKNDNTLLTVDMVNPDFDGGAPAAHNALHIFRAKLLWRGVCYEHLRLTNYLDQPLKLALALELAADFADVFEVRGMTRPRRGRMQDPDITRNSLGFRYEGLDDVVRCTVLHLDEPPQEITHGAVRYDIELAPHGGHELNFRCEFRCGERDSGVLSSYEDVLWQSMQGLRRQRSRDCTPFSSNEQFNDWLYRSQADIHMLVTQTGNGLYPYAGIPWFSTPFGRDGIITALEYLWINPDIARGVLAYLAQRQARALDPGQEAEPGKILHEVRLGEMPALGEVPFARYYGSVDSTPLFVMLAGAYYERTGDIAFIGSIWENLLAALRWIDEYGDVDGDGFIEYQRHNPRGLRHQGWKDSDNAVFHADGAPAEGLIALCEVQGYVYAAKSQAAVLAHILGHHADAERLQRAADTLRQRFDAAFWCDDIGTYALALDGAKQPCRVRTSNAGQVLFSGIAAAERVERVVGTLMDAAGFSGWGIRTVSAGEARYNPMSYHNGSVWPHDNALVAAGFARYGRKELSLCILTSLFEASMYADLRRLPELFCGFTRRPDEGPTAYPSACIPQAWASAAVFCVLQACLGMTFNAAAREIRFHYPVLPDYLETLELRNLTLRDARVDLLLRRSGNSVSFSVLDKQGEINIAITV